MTRLTDDQRAVQEWAREFARREIAPRALVLDKDPESPEREALLRAAARAGVLGANLPEFLGGAGHDPVTGALITEELAAECGGCAVLFGANMLGMLPILLSGNVGAIERFVRPIAKSWETDHPKLAALAATEPDTGSDFIMGHPGGRMRTRVEKKDGGYLINGRKIFISNGSLASVITVFATHDPAAPIRESSSCFVLSSDTKGFSVGQIFEKMGQRASPAAELLFDDVWVPEENRLGNEGGGFALNRLIMSVTRTPIGALALGIARSAYEKALTYAESRRQGGGPIIGHQAVEIMLADMAIRVEAARGLVHAAASSLAAGKPSLKLSSMAKTFASDAAVTNALDAIQILGGYGYMQEYGVEKLLRDAKLTQIYEGTNQINRFEIMEAVAAERAA